MARGRNNKIKQDGISVQPALNQLYHHINHHYKIKINKGRSIKHHISQESKFIYQQNVNLLQEDIKRIFYKSLYYDLKITHKYKVVCTNQCIIRIRSPWLFSVLRPYFSYENNTAYCCIKQFEIYQQVTNFVRLLYTNLDISYYERILIQFILNASSSFFDSSESLQSKFICDKADTSYMSCYLFGNVTANDVNVKSPISSDMADSGLETGSMISPQETISENSSTDLDEPNESRVVKKTNEEANSSDESHLTGQNFNGKDLLNETDQVRDEIAEYESRVLSEPFYELQDESDDDEHTNSYLPTRSFEFRESDSIFLSSKNGKKCDETITQSLRTSSITVEHHNDIKDSCTTSNYYFIDASSLNDDIDVATTNTAGYPNDVNGKLTWSNPQLPSSCYIPTSRSNNFFLNNDPFKLPNRKIMNTQNQYEEILEFNQEPKMGKLDSLVVQSEFGSSKNANKESLVVEIKEADSGESAQHSPCPDNTKIDNLQKAQDKLVNDDSDQQQQQTDVAETKPVLIRRNTFELDANDEKLSSLRQEYERRQGSLVFQNSITQYSQHRIDGDSYFETVDQSDKEIIIDNLNLNSDSQINISSVYDFVDKHNVTENNGKPIRRFSNVDNKSIVQSITRSASDKFLANYDADEDDSSYNSLPISINNELSRNQARSKLRRNEAAPIVSGGASSSDFQKPLDSPIVKRKTESTPIVSGGSVIISEPELKEKYRARSSKVTSSMTAWVVDMSDCTKNGTVEKKNKPSQLSMSASFSPLTNSSKQEESDEETEKTQHSSLGYFVNLDDIKSPKERPKEGLNKHRRRTSDTASEKNYCEFFIDLSDKSTNKSSGKLSDKLTHNRAESLVSPTVSSNAVKSSMASSQPTDNKKNIFSMFIDLNEPVKPKPKLRLESEGRQNNQVIKSSSSSQLSDKQHQLERLELSRDSEDPSSTSDKKPKSGVFMFIESDSPLVRRRTLSSSRPAFKRHSWNTDKGLEQQQQQQPVVNEQINNLASKRVHKRAHSLSVDRVGDFRKLLAANRKSDSSHSLNEAASKLEACKLDSSTSSASSTGVQPSHESLQQQKGQMEQQLLHQLEPKEDTFDYDMRDTPPNSHVEIINEELLISLKCRNYQELDAINEQSMKEINKTGETNEANETNESNEISQTNEKSDSKERIKSFQQDDGCCSESSVWEKTPTENSGRRKSETFDISSSVSGPSSASDNLDFKLPDFLDTKQHKLEIIRAAGSRQDNKLRLQNNDKMIKNNSARTAPPTSFVRLSDLDKRPLMNSTNAGILATTSQDNSYRFSNSVTETSWIESKLVTSARSMEPSLRSLNKKLPLGIASGTLKSDNYDEFGFEGDAEAVISESDLSSLQSSMGRSGQGSTEETETSSFAIGKPQNKLGEDLLRMFLEEINPDVMIDVSGRRIKAHKCILSSRCQYFAAILSGGWIESAGNIISLQGYSYSAVHFALCHIYSGESCIPDSISIVELATLADMLCLEGLKEVIGFTLKVKYCHLFHKPCNGCSVGVLECMPLAAAYGLDEVYRKSLRWVTRHFVKIWPTKEFATLPRELMDKCYHQHIVHMNVDNILQTIMDCNKLLTTLPNVRWAEPVFRLVSNLLDVSMKYLTDNFASVLGNESFQGLDRELTWNISRLEDHLLAAAERLPPEQACKVYSKLDKMFACTQTDESQRTKIKWSSLFQNLMNKIRGQVEKCLIRDAARAARTNAWLKMDLELRRRIQELACLVILPNELPIKRPSRHSNFLKEPKERQEAKTPLNHTPPNRNLDLRKVKMAISEHNDKTLKQTPLLQTRKIMNKPQTDPLERKLQNKKLTDVSNVSRPKSWPNKMEVKSRYLEPRNRPAVKESVLQSNQEKTLGQQRRKIMISSSDSSRTSSPAMKRAAEKKTMLKISKVPIKKEGRALSSDSLTETSSRLSVKKEVTSKSCGITRPESPLLKAKDVEAGLSVDSLADTKKRPLTKKTGKMDTSMSTDSLMTDVTTITTPKSAATNKSSPVLSKTVTNTNISQTRNYDKFKKSSPPTQQRNISVPTAGTPSSVRRPARSLESSTAASRSRAAAVVNAYHGSLNLRKSLLDAAKAPDIPSRVLNSPSMNRTALRQNSYSMRSSFAALSKTDKHDKKEESATNNQRSNSSPSSKRSPKSNTNSRLSKSNFVLSKQKASKVEDKSSNKTRSQTSSGPDKDAPKFLNQSSRSGTFLKDEPTILNKSDIETAAIDV